MAKDRVEGPSLGPALPAPKTTTKKTTKISFDSEEAAQKFIKEREEQLATNRTDAKVALKITPQQTQQVKNPAQLAQQKLQAKLAANPTAQRQTTELKGASRTQTTQEVIMQQKSAVTAGGATNLGKITLPQDKGMPKLETKVLKLVSEKLGSFSSIPEVLNHPETSAQLRNLHGTVFGSSTPVSRWTIMLLLLELHHQNRDLHSAVKDASFKIKDKSMQADAMMTKLEHLQKTVVNRMKAQQIMIEADAKFVGSNMETLGKLDDQIRKNQETVAEGRLITARTAFNNASDVVRGFRGPPPANRPPPTPEDISAARDRLNRLCAVTPATPASDAAIEREYESLSRLVGSLEARQMVRDARPDTEAGRQARVSDQTRLSQLETRARAADDHLSLAQTELRSAEEAFVLASAAANTQPGAPSSYVSAQASARVRQLEISGPRRDEIRAVDGQLSAARAQLSRLESKEPRTPEEDEQLSAMRRNIRTLEFRRAVLRDEEEAVLADARHASNALGALMSRLEEERSHGHVPDGAYESTLGEASAATNAAMRVICDPNATPEQRRAARRDFDSAMRDIEGGIEERSIAESERTPEQRREYMATWRSHRESVDDERGIREEQRHVERRLAAARGELSEIQSALSRPAPPLTEAERTELQSRRDLLERELVELGTRGPRLSAALDHQSRVSAARAEVLALARTEYPGTPPGYPSSAAIAERTRLAEETIAASERLRLIETEVGLRSSSGGATSTALTGSPDPSSSPALAMGSESDFRGWLALSANGNPVAHDDFRRFGAPVTADDRARLDELATKTSRTPEEERELNELSARAASANLVSAHTRRDELLGMRTRTPDQEAELVRLNERIPGLTRAAADSIEMLSYPGDDARELRGMSALASPTEAQRRERRELEARVTATRDSGIADSGYAAVAREYRALSVKASPTPAERARMRELEGQLAGALAIESAQWSRTDGEIQSLEFERRSLVAARDRDRDASRSTTVVQQRIDDIDTRLAQLRGSTPLEDVRGSALGTAIDRERRLLQQIATVEARPASPERETELTRLRGELETARGEIGITSAVAERTRVLRELDWQRRQPESAERNQAVARLEARLAELPDDRGLNPADARRARELTDERATLTPPTVTTPTDAQRRRLSEIDTELGRIEGRADPRLSLPTLLEARDEALRMPTTPAAAARERTERLAELDEAIAAARTRLGASGSSALSVGDDLYREGELLIERRAVAALPTSDPSRATRLTAIDTELAAIAGRTAEPQARMLRETRTVVEQQLASLAEQRAVVERLPASDPTRAPRLAALDRERTQLTERRTGIDAELALLTERRTAETSGDPATREARLAEIDRRIATHRAGRAAGPDAELSAARASYARSRAALEAHRGAVPVPRTEAVSGYPAPVTYGLPPTQQTFATPEAEAQAYERGIAAAYSDYYRFSGATPGGDLSPEGLPVGYTGSSVEARRGEADSAYRAIEGRPERPAKPASDSSPRRPPDSATDAYSVALRGWLDSRTTLRRLEAERPPDSAAIATARTETTRLYDAIPAPPLPARPPDTRTDPVAVATRNWLDAEERLRTAEAASPRVDADVTAARSEADRLRELIPDRPARDPLPAEPPASDTSPRAEQIRTWLRAETTARSVTSDEGFVAAFGTWTRDPNGQLVLQSTTAADAAPTPLPARLAPNPHSLTLAELNNPLAITDDARRRAALDFRRDAATGMTATAYSTDFGTWTLGADGNYVMSTPASANGESNPMPARLNPNPHHLTVAEINNPHAITDPARRDAALAFRRDAAGARIQVLQEQTAVRAAALSHRRTDGWNEDHIASYTAAETRLRDARRELGRDPEENEPESLAATDPRRALVTAYREAQHVMNLAEARGVASGQRPPGNPDPLVNALAESFTANEERRAARVALARFDEAHPAPLATPALRREREGLEHGVARATERATAREETVRERNQELRNDSDHPPASRSTAPDLPSRTAGAWVSFIAGKAGDVAVMVGKLGFGEQNAGKMLRELFWEAMGHYQSIGADARAKHDQFEGTIEQIHAELKTMERKTLVDYTTKMNLIKRLVDAHVKAGGQAI